MNVGEEGEGKAAVHGRRGTQREGRADGRCIIGWMCGPRLSKAHSSYRTYSLVKRCKSLLVF